MGRQTFSILWDKMQRVFQLGELLEMRERAGRSEGGWGREGSKPTTTSPNNGNWGVRVPFSVTSKQKINK